MRRTKAKADYVHSIRRRGGKNFLLIEDLDQGNMSVTNDIENVVQEIAETDGINPLDHVILYLDSDKSWNEWSAEWQNYKYNAGKDAEGAISFYLEKNL